MDALYISISDETREKESRFPFGSVAGTRDSDALNDETFRRDRTSFERIAQGERKPPPPPPSRTRAVVKRERRGRGKLFQVGA